MPVPFSVTTISLQRPAGGGFTTIYTARRVKMVMGGSWDAIIPDSEGLALHKATLYDDLNSAYQTYDVVDVLGQDGQSAQVLLSTWRVYRVIQRSGRASRLRHDQVPLVALPVPRDGLPTPASVRRAVETPDGAGGATPTTTDYPGYTCRLVAVTMDALKGINQGRIEVQTKWLIVFPLGTLVNGTGFRPRDQILIGTDIYLIQQIVDHSYATTIQLQCAKLT